LAQREAAYDLKAAALCLGALAATPVSTSTNSARWRCRSRFWLRLGNARSYLPKELINIALFCVLIVIFPFLKFPVGFAMLLPTAGLAARRIFVRPASPQP
jgi:hypothetical protein